MADEGKKQLPVEKGSKSLRSNLAEQIQCLQRKHAAEMDVLESMRGFLKQKADLDKEYAQGLQKLTQSHLQKRKKAPPPSIPGFDRAQHKGVMEVWINLLEVTAESASKRRKMAEDVLDKVAEEVKQYKKDKDLVFKKQLDLGLKMDSEMLEAVKSTSKRKKSYHDLEKTTTESRQKYQDVESRWRKKELKLFESSSALEKNYNKTSDRLKECQKKSTVARNEYLLSLAGTNAHLKKFYDEDLVELMKVMDGPFYDRVKSYYQRYAQSEVDVTSFAQTQFEDLCSSSALVSRDYVLSCFVRKFPVFTTTQHYPFEPYGQDQVSAMGRDHGAEIYLDKHARKWARDVVQEERMVADRMKAVRGVRSVSVAYSKNPDFGTAEASMEAEQRIEQLMDDVRKSVVQQTTLNAKLDLLRQGGIDVDKWLSKAKDSIKPKGTLEVARAASNPVSTQSTIGSLDNLLDLDRTDNADPFDSLSIASTGSGQSLGVTKSCTAQYSYMARHQDELSITEGETLEIIEWDDGEGWTKGRSKQGDEGYFPQNYVQPVLSSRPPSPPRTNGLLCPPLDQTDTSPVMTRKTSSDPPTAQPSSSTSTGVVELLRALYSYEAVTDEELSFREGAIIELLRTDDNGVDDGWWEGRYLGQVGVFPSLVVERLSESVDGPSNDYSTASSEADSTSPPPPGVPPPALATEEFDSTLLETPSTPKAAFKPNYFGYSDSFDEEDDIDGLV